MIKFTVNPFPREVGRGKRGIHRAVSRTAPTGITSEDVTGPGRVLFVHYAK